MSAVPSRVVLERDADTGDWAVYCPELPGCASAGVTAAEALAKLREAVELYLDPEPLDHQVSARWGEGKA